MHVNLLTGLAIQTPITFHPRFKSFFLGFWLFCFVLHCVCFWRCELSVKKVWIVWVALYRGELGRVISEWNGVIIFWLQRGEVIITCFSTFLTFFTPLSFLSVSRVKYILTACDLMKQQFFFFFFWNIDNSRAKSI